MLSSSYLSTPFELNNFVYVYMAPVMKKQALLLLQTHLICLGFILDNKFKVNLLHFSVKAFKVLRYVLCITKKL